MINQKYRNKKNGTYYFVVNIAIDATNCRNGNKVVVYKSCDNEQLFVRDLEEFIIKFDVVEDEI